MKDISYRGRRGNFLPGEKEEAWKTAIREKEAKIKPIIFSTSMVRAIQEGRKTQTRMVIKPQPPGSAGKIVLLQKTEGVPNFGRDKITLLAVGDNWGVEAPYQPGDLLWVQETWRCVKYDSMDGDLGYGVEFKDGQRKHFEFKDAERFHKFGKYAFKKGWKPSIFMPKEAARLFLLVKNNSVERLRDMTEEDAIAEGFPDITNFIIFWNRFNAKHGYPFESDPWVWKINFERKKSHARNKI